MAEDYYLDLVPDLDRKVAELAEVKAVALPIAEKIADRARSTAPHESGDYEASIQAEATPGGARVFASDYKAAWIEFGVPSQGVPAKFNIRSAAESLGLKFRGKGGGD